MEILLAIALWTAPAAVAQDGAPAPEGDASRLGTNVRYRYLAMPRGILNTWYLDGDDWTGAYAELERPGVSAHVVGLELAVEPRPIGFLFYAEYWKVNMDAGYWDDRDDGTQNQDDGDWLDPTNLGMVAGGFDFAHEFELTDPSADVWMGLRLGGGLGIGIPTGRIDQWHPGATFATSETNDCEPDLHAVDRAAAGCDPDRELAVPPVVPILDVDLALRFHFADTGILRIDGGLHDLLYVGVGAGAVF